MDIKEYKLILDSLQMTGIYVIREDSHEILYYNRRVREVAPNIKPGMICHELWVGSCKNCPLNIIGDRKEASAINYNDPFGKAVEIRATRILWEDTIPAFVISVTPYAEKCIYGGPAEETDEEESSIKNGDIIDALAELNLGIYIVDLETGTTRMVRSTEEVTKFMKAEKCPWDWMMDTMGRLYTDPDYQKEFTGKFSTQALKEGWKNKEDKRSLVYRTLINGQWKYASATAFFKEDRKGKGYAIITFQDVDERTRENMIRIENDRRMAVIIKSRYSIMNVVDLHTGQCERVFMREGVLGTRLVGDYSYYINLALEKHVAEDDKKKFAEKLLLENLQKRAESVHDYEEEVFQYRQKKTPVRWVEEHVLYIRQGKKTVVNILGRDITEEKLKEEAAQRAAAEKASIINSLSSMFFATYYVDLEKDLFKGATQKADVETALEEIRSYSQGIKSYAEKFIHPDDRKHYLEHVSLENLGKTLSKEKLFTSIEYRKIPVEGKEDTWIRGTMVLAETDSEGKPKKAVYVAQDITESKQKEAKEQHALAAACEVANHANAAKSEFMSRMSHDIRTPLNAIIGMTAIAGRYLDDRERVEDCLSKIVVSSRHLLSLINEILDMSKIESGKIELSEEELNLSDLVNNLMTMIRPAMDQKKHKFTVRISDIKSENVIGDSMRLQQVFMNILGNSVKYTPEGGSIEMEIKEKPSRVYGYSCYEFTFQDNGIGMSKEFQKEIFEPFSRAEDSRIGSIEGTGLGMTITRNIIRMMDGSIEVESELNKGTKFIVTLMMKHCGGEEPDLKELADLPVLVADDDETTGQMACLLLENIGMKGEYVLSGEEAVERVWERHLADDDYFSVILDWKMPGMDGIETARKIRATVGPDIPIIILSAYDWNIVEKEAREAGINGFIAKPLFKSRLVYLFSQFVEKDKRQEKKEEDSVSEKLPQGKRVLLAEDNELNREIATEFIQAMGVEVDCAENGQEAVERFKEMQEGYYDLIFMDIQMPVMNGYEASHSIRMLPRKDAAVIPIIALTANAFSEDIIKSKNAGMNEHLSKPLSVEALENCLRHWLGSRTEF